MNRTEKEEYIIGFVSLISNKIVQFGDLMLTDITFPQWFLLMMISKMEQQEKTINSIAEFVGSSRQNVKKMLNLLAGKGYVLIEKSSSDKRALNVKPAILAGLFAQAPLCTVLNCPFCIGLKPFICSQAPKRHFRPQRYNDN